jgi:glycosyltransferase involved in cell wall biosynthesis
LYQSRSRKEFVVGFAGRLISRKGWKEFLEAVSMLPVKKELIFRIAGDGPERAQFEKKCQQLKLSELIDFRGIVQDMNQFYPTLDILVIPSRWEPMGMVAVEAMACGIPVVAARVGGLAEIIHHRQNGLLYDPGKVSELAENIWLLRQDRDLYEFLSRRARQDADRYHPEQYMKKLEFYYDDITRKK